MFCSSNQASPFTYENGKFLFSLLFGKRLPCQRIKELVLRVIQPNSQIVSQPTEAPPFLQQKIEKRCSIIDSKFLMERIKTLSDNFFTKLSHWKRGKMETRNPCSNRLIEDSKLRLMFWKEFIIESKQCVDSE